MNTRIYLVRHAEAQGNVNRTFQGHSDCPVTERGMRQLDCLAERFRTVRFDALYSSPLLRARQTAEAVNRYHGLELQIDPGLIEINGGELEGMHWNEIPERFPQQQHDWDVAPQNYCAPGGDRMIDVYERITAAIDRIVRANSGKIIAVVSHGCAIRNYLCFANGWGIEQLRNIMWEENTAVSCIDYDEDFRPHIVYQSDAEHLPDELRTLARQSWWKTTITEEAAK